MTSLPIPTNAPDPLRLVHPPVSCEIIRSIADLGHLRDEWDPFVASCGGRIEQTLEWIRVWWEHYGHLREPRILVFRDRNDIVGLAPMCTGRVSLGPISLRVAKIMGADFAPAVCDLPIRSGWEGAVLDELVQRMICDERCETIAFGPIVGTSPRLAAMRDVVARREDLITVFHDRVVGRHATIALPETFDDYIASLSKKQRNNYRRNWRALESNFVVSVDMVTQPDSMPAVFHDFVEQHTRQWARRGRLGHFSDWPEAESFHADLIRAMPDRVRLQQVVADEHVIARQYGLTFGGRCHWLASARAVSPRWERYGLGRLNATKLFEHEIEHGTHTIDLGVGHYEYKLRLGAREQNVHALLLVGNHDGLRTRARMFCSLADVLDRLYYRLWYLRLAPRLRGRQPALSPTWIRSRL